MGQGAEEKSEKFAQPPVSSRNEGVSGFQRSHSCAWVGVGVTGDSNARTSSSDPRSESRSDFRASAAGSSHTHTHSTHTHAHTHTPAPHTHTHAHAHAHSSAAGLSRAQQAQQPQREAAHAAAPDARGFKDLLADDLRYEDTYIVVPQVRGHIYSSASRYAFWSDAYGGPQKHGGLRRASKSAAYCRYIRRARVQRPAG